MDYMGGLLALGTLGLAGCVMVIIGLWDDERGMAAGRREDRAYAYDAPRDAAVRAAAAVELRAERAAYAAYIAAREAPVTVRR